VRSNDISLYVESSAIRGIRVKTVAISAVVSLFTTVAVLLVFPHIVRPQPEIMRPEPERYRYEHGVAGLLVRIDQKTGNADQLFPNGWKPCAPANSGRNIFNDIADEQKAAQQPK